jgi:hypothetical protein
MTEDVVQALISAAGVTVGLYVLWRLWPRHAPREPGPPALVAGAVSGLVTLVARLIT